MSCGGPLHGSKKIFDGAGNSLKLALLGNGSVARALRPLLAADERFTVAGLHSRSEPAAESAAAFLENCRADTLVELTTLNPFTGEPATSHIRAAFSLGMHVVTANKGPLALFYSELAREASERGVRFLFESAVMDGAPVFNLFRHGMPRVRVLGIRGALNSTTKVVIEALEQGRTFDEGLADAQAMGVAEADASFDIDGWDSAAKIAALANVLMDASSTPLLVDRAGIREWTPERVRQLAAGDRKLVLVSRARLEGGQLRLSARPEVLERNDVLAAGAGTSNAILFETDLMGTFGTVSLSPAVEQTAFGVYADLVEIYRECYA